MDFAAKKYLTQIKKKVSFLMAFEKAVKETSRENLTKL